MFKWLKKIRKSVGQERPVLTEEDFGAMEKFVEEWLKNLPFGNEFTLSAPTAREGEIQYPDLHFIADPKVPGLFRAKVDPDFIMGQTNKWRSTCSCATCRKPEQT